ncbi:hypothetical protein M427DRAFT_507553 [Gonapodya prolifera JEL478]|uniref:Uncharacterized protein n=1 Tax=Gonapodya prolifera (strain JEL478) TaxID=1344416 RepID=A0A139A1J3_GONPJ|nr:hypothetical protein M427DRAFT_507553 [Gonapodya prolifera JEL478]|eukprot:KXS10611.1 hypothetical protein M427DRAFT_507553 [Gonapodya prolifera JEL478]
MLVSEGRTTRFGKADVARLHIALQLLDSLITSNCLAISGRDALCILLKCLLYPGRLGEVAILVGRDISQISRITLEVMEHIYGHCRHVM